MNNNLEITSVSHSETTIRGIITNIIKKVDKNGKDYWIVRLQISEFDERTYLAFSTDYNLISKTKSILENSAELIRNRWASLKTRKTTKDNLEKIIEIDLET